MSNLAPYDSFVLNDLKNKKSSLIISNEQIDESIGISVTIPQTFKTSSAEIDQEIIDNLNEINNIKREIVKISQDAFNNISGITSANTPLFSCEVSSDVSSYNKYNFVAPETVESFKSFRGKVVFDTLTNSFIGTESTITRVPIYPDILQAWFFDELEGNLINVSSGSGFRDPILSGEYQILLSERNNLGIGKTSNPFFNSEFNGVTNFSNSIGFFYDIIESNNNSSVGICNIRSQIDPLMARINGLRSKVTELSEGVSKIKHVKHLEQLSLWSLHFTKADNLLKIEDYERGIKTIEDKYN